MDQSDGPEFDLDEAVRQWKMLYPCENSASIPGDGQVADRACLRTEDGAPYVAGDFLQLGIVATEQISWLLPSCFDGAIDLHRTPYEAIVTEAGHTVEDIPGKDILNHHEQANYIENPTSISPTMTPNHSNLDPNTDFIFRSGATILEDNSKPSISSRSLDTNSGIKCEHPGCNYRGTFNRKYDLTRHMRKHTSRAYVACPFELCGTKFYRSDKLGLHIRRAHTDDDMCSCPIPGCNTGDQPFLLLRLHARNHFIRREKEMEFLFSVALSNIPFNNRQCPIDSCGKNAILDVDMSYHLKTHSLDERSENRVRLEESGYDPKTTKVICPVCRMISDTNEDFGKHFESSHIVTDYDHIKRLQQYLLHRKNGNRYKGDALYHSWTPKPLPYDIYSDISCCYEVRINPRHHIKYLQDVETLRPYRYTVLKLWAEFGAHPVFNDIMPHKLGPTIRHL